MLGSASTVHEDEREAQGLWGQTGLSVFKYRQQLLHMARFRLKNMFKVEVKKGEAEILSMCKIA